LIFCDGFLIIIIIQNKTKPGTRKETDPFIQKINGVLQYDVILYICNKRKVMKRALEK